MIAVGEPAAGPEQACVPQVCPAVSSSAALRRRVIIAAALLSVALHAGIGVLASRSPWQTRGIPATEFVHVEIVVNVPEAAEVPEDQPAMRPADEAPPAIPSPPAVPVPTEAKPGAESAASVPPSPLPRAKPRSSPTPAPVSRRHRPDRPEPDAVADAASPQPAGPAADGGAIPGAIAPEHSEENPPNGAAVEQSVTGKEEAQLRSHVGRRGEPEADRAQLLDVYSRAVWKRIAAHKPKGLRLSGTARLSFTVGADGALLAASIVRSSGNPDLDQLAVRTVREAAPLPPPPAGLRTMPLTFEISFAFR